MHFISVTDNNDFNNEANGSLLPRHEGEPCLLTEGKYAEWAPVELESPSVEFAVDLTADLTVLLSSFQPVHIPTDLPATHPTSPNQGTCSPLCLYT
jgi:hypothetical protein